MHQLDRHAGQSKTPAFRHRSSLQLFTARRTPRQGVKAATVVTHASTTPHKAHTTERPKIKQTPTHDGCEVYVDADGAVVPVMCVDYGFRSGFGRLNQGIDGEIPKNIVSLGWDNYKMEFRQLRKSFRVDEYQAFAPPSPNPLRKVFNTISLSFVKSLASLDVKLEEAGLLSKLEPDPVPEEVLNDDGEPIEAYKEMRAKLAKLRLDNAAVWEREHRREATPGWVAHEAPWPIRAAYLSICWVMDVIYDRRPIQRFWFLEVVARMPYFSYISMLHLYESLGWWRAGAELRKVHFAEEWNEIHHLMIMESLGGDQLWIDRFMAQHAAVFYYWVLIGFFAFSPSLAYVFSEMVEGHAVDTYTQFVEDNAELLKSIPPPLIALQYYKGEDLYYFDALQTAGDIQERRRPTCNNLYDVFTNIKGDEEEHVKTMTACRDYSIVDDLAKRKKALSRPGSKAGSSNSVPDPTAS
ncbi:hypothetical protein WJX73_007777 [Symbiochloris irregularis]|uniref:Ubiquinol oxidase n=1 Tax=Symbiochloris irregularis TaxID=706552 RepID=A0AAW1P117_9CHLO